MKLRICQVILLIAVTVYLSSCSPHKKAASVKPKEHAPVEKAAKLKYAEKYAVDPDKIKSLQLYSFIDEWYGVPYKLGGREKSGIDCSNFTSLIYETVYKTPLRGASYELVKSCDEIKCEELQEGDLVFFKIDSPRISHVGVYLQNNKFVHATRGKGVMINDLNEPYYKKYYFKSGKVKPTVGNL